MGKTIFYSVFLLTIIVISGCITNKEIQVNNQQQSIADCTQKNQEWCYTVSFSDRGFGESCAESKDGCLAMRAGEAKNAAICETIATSANKEECYINVAGSMGEITLCDKISNNEGKSRCMGKVALNKNNSQLCSTAPSSDDCYLEFAMSPDAEKSVCDSIKDPGKKESCNFFTNRP